jgi:hypothetical protein
MRKSFYTFHFSLFILLLFSCSKNDYSSYCPTWKGFTYKIGSYPNYVPGNSGSNIYLNAGDSIHITACQDQRGHLINGTYYTWTLCVDTLDTKDNDDPSDDVLVHANIVYNQHTNYDGYANGADDPICHMLIPESAQPDKSGKPDTIKFVARYIYSGQGVTIENGNIIDNTSYSGRITPQSGSTGGGAAGYFYFRLNAN